MTPHTEAERAAFEAWARGYGTWEVKRDDDAALGTTGYTDITLTVAWHAVQAARRAPAAPVPQGLVKDPKWQIETCHRMFDRMGIERDDGEDFYSVWGRVCLAFEKVANVEIHIPLCGEVVYKQVAAAPQPPEAAPVKLPEPVYYVLCTINDAGVTRTWFDTKPHAGATPVYTEQQLRELLAAHGIQERST